MLSFFALVILTRLNETIVVKIIKIGSCDSSIERHKEIRYIEMFTILSSNYEIIIIDYIYIYI